MPHDQSNTATVLELNPGQAKSRKMSASEREAFEAGKAEAMRSLMREKFGGTEYDPVPPFELSETALKHWHQGLKAIPKPLRRPGYEDALARYAIAMSTIERTTADFDRMGPLVEGRDGGLVKNPLATVRAVAFAQVALARKELAFPTAWTERSMRKERK
jgi:hypothetical protein